METRIGLAVHEIFADLLRTDMSFKQAFTHAAIRQQLTTEAIQTIAKLKDNILTFVQTYKTYPHKTEFKFGLTADYQPCDFFMPAVYFRGVCDLVITGGIHEVIDFKTTQAPNKEIIQQYEKQLRLYAWALGKHFNAPHMQAKLFFVPNASFHDVDLQNVENESIDFLNTLRTVTTAENTPNPGKHCSYCSYSEGCDARYVE